MRRLGSAFMAFGVFVGVATGLAVLTGVDVPGVGSWLVGVAVAKLGFISAFALIAAGAVMHRIGRRSTHDTDVERVEETLQPLEAGQRALGPPPAEPLRPRDVADLREPRHR